MPKSPEKFDFSKLRGQQKFEKPPKRKREKIIEAQMKEPAQLEDLVSLGAADSLEGADEILRELKKSPGFSLEKLANSLKKIEDIQEKTLEEQFTIFKTGKEIKAKICLPKYGVAAWLIESIIDADPIGTIDNRGYQYQKTLWAYKDGWKLPKTVFETHYYGAETGEKKWFKQFEIREKKDKQKDKIEMISIWEEEQGRSRWAYKEGEIPTREIPIIEIEK